MKKFIVFALCAAMVVSLAACGTKKQESTSASAKSEAASEAVSEVPQTVGGYQINDDETVGYLPDDVQEAFDKAMEGYTGMGFTPVAYLGSQVVAGTNYMIMCKGSMVTAEPTTELYAVVVYADLQGNAEITSVVKVDLGELEEQAESSGTEQGLAGGWTVTDDYKVANMPADVQKAFDEAMDGLVGATHEPMAYLGSKVVSGVIYAVLCHTTLSDKDGTNQISVAFIYQDAQNKSSIENIANFNLADYVEN